MKKILSLLLITTLSLVSLISCEVFSKNRELSIGVHTIQDGNTLTETAAAIITEEDGAILLLRIDSFSYSPEFDAYGAPVITVPTTASEAGGDAYLEIQRFEEYAVGKTVEELLSLYEDEAIDPGLNLSKIGDYISAIEKADKNEYKTKFRSKNLGFAIAINVNVSADADKNSFTLTSDFAAIATWKNTVAAAIIDANEATLSTDGSSVTSLSYKGTKLEQGDGYNMKKNPYAIGEWYEQAADYTANIKRLKINGEDTSFPVNTAGCTIGTDAIRAALSKAVQKLQ
jgi:hypothetical protein